MEHTCQQELDDGTYCGKPAVMYWHGYWWCDDHKPFYTVEDIAKMMGMGDDNENETDNRD